MRVSSGSCLAVFAVFAFFLGAWSPALAKNDHGGHGKGGHHESHGHFDKENSGKEGREGGRGSVSGIIRDDREIIARYFAKSGAGCPPGLAKKNNGCLPPGQAKKRYQVGHTLPDGLWGDSLTDELLALLSPPPRGYTYRRVDGDVLLVAEATKKVIDAVVMLSAVQ